MAILKINNIDENVSWAIWKIDESVEELSALYAPIEGELKELIEDGRVITTIIPDIESINYGRGVGYEVIEHIPPTEIGEISATKIRKQMRKEGKL